MADESMTDESNSAAEEEFDDDVECCGNCEYFTHYSDRDPKDKSVPDGMCRRRSPQIMPAPSGHPRVLVTFFPEVDRSDWCGEYEEEDDGDDDEEEKTPTLPDEKFGKLDWKKPPPRDLWCG